jgi:hypothetical protein
MQSGSAHNASGAGAAAAGSAAGRSQAAQASNAQRAAAGTAATNRNQSASGAQGAAAGATVANRNAPQASGAQGAAAGVAAANRNAPAASGAQGAAAGAAVANRNAPAASGAQGAAAGAAVANRNAPQVSGVQGAAAGVAAANYNAPAASGAEGAAAGYAAASGPVDHPSMYDEQWYSEHQGAWSPAGWAAGAAWAPTTWEAVAGHCGIVNITPASYDYGRNINCIGGNVIVNGQPAGTAEEFSQEADAIAEAGTKAATSATDQWLPLGVFALVRDEHHHPQLIMQFAINQQGIVRGNYTDEVTGSTLPIHGEVDLQSRRAAWTVGDNRYVVMEAGLSNLTEHEAPALVHKNGTTQRWLLVRLAQPSQGGNDAASVGAPR